MAAPTNAFGNITLEEIEAGKPGKTEIFQKYRGNELRLFEILLAAGVDPDDAAIAIGHRHRGKTLDGTEPITLQPQENLIADGDDVNGWTQTGDTTDDNICFGTSAANDHLISRIPAAVSRRKALHKAFVSANIIKKIKSSGGQGRFTCSMHMKRHADAAGVVGGTLRFGLWDGTNFITGAFVDIEFDDVTTEYQRFYFVSDTITRPTALNLRSEWVAHPSDWDTIVGDDTVGYHGGYMVTNGQGVAKWDISHHDGTADDYDASEEFYWWDEVITEVQLTP